MQKHQKSQIAMLKVSAKNVVRQAEFLPEHQCDGKVCPMNSSGHTAMSKRNWCYKTEFTVKSDLITVAINGIRGKSFVFHYEVSIYTTNEIDEVIHNKYPTVLRSEIYQEIKVKDCGCYLADDRMKHYCKVIAVTLVKTLNDRSRMKGDENAKVMTTVTAGGEQIILRRERMTFRLVPKVTQLTMGRAKGEPRHSVPLQELGDLIIEGCPKTSLNEEPMNQQYTFLSEISFLKVKNNGGIHISFRILFGLLSELQGKPKTRTRKVNKDFSRLPTEENKCYLDKRIRPLAFLAQIHGVVSPCTTDYESV
ncbi:hypothetical protein GH733_013452 [Mirounga leonina]|nr:hypothetical protein GH733_013452 [Mirounga leonina]